MALAQAAPAHNRILIFLNVVLQALLALAAVVGIVWIAQTYKHQYDLTRSGVNSLSPRTVSLLKHIDQDVQITAIYTVLSEYDKRAQKRRDTVRDLLALYEGSGRPHVSTRMIDPMKDQGQIQTFLEKLRQKPVYADEAKPHAAAIQKFLPLAEQIRKECDEAFDRMKKAGESQPTLLRIREYKIVANNMGLTGRDVANTLEDMKSVTQPEPGKVPKYGAAIESAKKMLTSARAALADSATWMSSDGAAINGLDPELKQYFNAARGRIQPMLEQIDALLKETADLKPVKLEEIYTQLSRYSTAPPILVETANDSRVVSFEDVWPPITDPNAARSPDGDDREFAGEQAISSAILQLTQKERTAVIFTRFGGASPIHPDFSQMNPMMQQMPQAPFQDLNTQLTRANFITVDWDVATQKSVPEDQLKEATRRVFVVMPPENEPPNPMQQTPGKSLSPEQKQAILDAVGKSGMAIFLTGWKPPMMMGPPAAYEFGEYLKGTWGVDPRTDTILLPVTKHPQKPGLWLPANREAMLTTEAMHFTAQAIVKPLQASAAAFVVACPLDLVQPASRPQGVMLESMLEVPGDAEVWGISDIRGLQAQLQEKQGIEPSPAYSKPPFTLAVAGTKDNQRVVVIANTLFAADSVASQQDIIFSGNALVPYIRYPANLDLFTNSIHWLTGDSDRISVGPRSAQVPRLSKLKPGPLTSFWVVFMVAIWPAIALLIGGGVWMVRRR